MSGLFYPRLALRNLVKNRSTYLPYLLTGTVCVAMYYIMQSISMNEGLMQVPGAAVALTIFWLGTVVIAIFCVILIFYTNSFLIKRRRGEFGLYCVLAWRSATWRWCCFSRRCSPPCAAFFWASVWGRCCRSCCSWRFCT